VRTAGTAFRPLGRGSRIPIGDSKFIRFFMWWKDLDTSDSYRNRVDLDMNLSFMDEDFAVTGEVAFYNLTNGAATHSGDITSAPNGAAEFVDIRSEALAADNGARYVAMSVTSYTAQPFNTLTDALAGVMLRNDSGHGEVFEGTSVETAFSLTQDAVSVVPFIYDIEKRELIWLDQAVSTRGAFYYAGAARGRFAQMTEAVVRRAPVTVYEVLSAHAEARGTEGAAPATLGEDIAFSPETLLSDWL
jgi:stress response protein SCP2